MTGEALTHLTSIPEDKELSGGVLAQLRKDSMPLSSVPEAIISMNTGDTIITDDILDPNLSRVSYPT